MAVWVRELIRKKAVQTERKECSGGVPEGTEIGRSLGV